MKRRIEYIRDLIKNYLLLSFVILTIVVGLVLYLLNYHIAANWALGIGALVAVIPLLWDMVTTIRSGGYGIDILAATAIIASVILRQDLAAIIIALMLTGGEALEDYAENRAKIELKTLLDNRPRTAHLIVKNGGTKDIPVNEVKVGDRLTILPGETVPVDCEILEGDSSFDESRITGESLPLYKKAGDNVLSGSINIEGSLIVKAIHKASESQYEQIIKLVRAAASTQAPFIRLADRYSIPFTLLAYIIAGAVWYTSGHAIRFLEVIVVATPCPLLLAAPIALISGMSRSAKHGIIVKNGASLEKLAQAQTVAFDKTGTLTNGKPTIDHIQTFKPYDVKTLLKFAAALEQNSNHVLAKVIVNYANDKKIKVKAAKQIKETAGLGLRGRFEGKDIAVGRWDFIQNHINVPSGFDKEKINTTSTFVTIDDELAGVISFVDQVRPKSKKLINTLKDFGLNVFMITGDNKATANLVAKQLGIDHVHAECLPGDKMKVTEEVKERPLIFVGDGVNDAPVLTLSDVGIALGAKGSTAASESADVVIMLDDVSRVASAIDIARRTFSIARQSILVGIFISIGLMALFATGHFKPVYGALLQEVVDVIVIFNALRAHSAWQERNKRTKKIKNEASTA